MNGNGEFTSRFSYTPRAAFPACVSGAGTNSTRMARHSQVTRCPRRSAASTALCSRRQSNAHSRSCQRGRYEPEPTTPPRCEHRYSWGMGRDTTQVCKKHALVEGCFRRMGWRQAGFTHSGLVILLLLPQDMPPATSCWSALLPLSGGNGGAGMSRTDEEQEAGKLAQLLQADGLPGVFVSTLRPWRDIADEALAHLTRSANVQVFVRQGELVRIRRKEDGTPPCPASSSRPFQRSPPRSSWWRLSP
jgi:hypothetical protein